MITSDYISVKEERRILCRIIDTDNDSILPSEGILSRIDRDPRRNDTWIDSKIRIKSGTIVTRKIITKLK